MVQSRNFVIKTNNFLLNPEKRYWVYSFIHSIGTCRMWRFLAILRSFFQSSLLYTLSCHPSPPTILPSSLTSSWILVNLLALLFPNSHIILFWEFYFLPFTVHVQTNVIYVSLLSLMVGFLLLFYYYYYYYYYLTAIGLTPVGSSTVHIYTQTVHRIQRTEHT
jgi:hypothetical protein